MRRKSPSGRHGSKEGFRTAPGVSVMLNRGIEGMIRYDELYGNLETSLNGRCVFSLPRTR